MTSTYLGAALGLFVFYGTMALVSVYSPSPPNWWLLIGSVFGFAVILAVVWAYRVSVRSK